MDKQTEIRELEQDLEYVQCWLRNCDTLAEYEEAFRELCWLKTEIQKAYDCGFVGE